MTRPEARRRALLVAMALALPFAAIGNSMALGTSSATVGSNTTASGTWVLYLHNRPTPPVGATTAQFGLTMTSSASTTTTLYNYDTNCDSRTGRLLIRGTALPGEATTCRYVTWRTASFASVQPLDGVLTLRIWARKTGTGGTNPTLTAYLRDFDPGTGAYVELGSASGAVSAGSGSAFAQIVLASTLNVTVPAGHQIELKLVAGGGSLDANLAYDTTAFPARLILLQQPAS